MAVVTELARAVVIILIAAVILVVAAGCAAVALRLGHGQPRVLPPRVYGSRSVHAVQDRPEPRALPAHQEVHLHFHGVSAADIAAALRQLPHEPGR